MATISKDMHLLKSANIVLKNNEYSYEISKKIYQNIAIAYDALYTGAISNRSLFILHAHLVVKDLEMLKNKDIVIIKLLEKLQTLDRFEHKRGSFSAEYNRSMDLLSQILFDELLIKSVKEINSFIKNLQ